MHRCLASITTATPKGFSVSCIQSSICASCAPAPACGGQNSSTTRGYLAQTGYSAIRYIGYMRLAKKRQHMVLAHGVQLYILHDHHLCYMPHETWPVYDLLPHLLYSLVSGIAWLWLYVSGVFCSPSLPGLRPVPL